MHASFCITPHERLLCARKICPSCYIVIPVASFELTWAGLYFVWETSPFCSQTSDSGPSEIGTQYNKPLYKGHFQGPK